MSAYGCQVPMAPSLFAVLTSASMLAYSRGPLFPALTFPPSGQPACPPYLKIFGWCLVRNLLPTSDVLASHHLSANPLCPLYHSTPRTVEHIFFSCPFALYATPPLKPRSISSLANPLLDRLGFPSLSFYSLTLPVPSTPSPLRFLTWIMTADEALPSPSPLLLAGLLLLEGIWTQCNFYWVRGLLPNIDLFIWLSKEQIASYSFCLQSPPTPSSLITILNQHIKGQHRLIVTDVSRAKNGQAGWAFILIEANLSFSFEYFKSFPSVLTLQAETVALHAAA